MKSLFDWLFKKPKPYLEKLTTLFKGELTYEEFEKLGEVLASFNKRITDIEKLIIESAIAETPRESEMTRENTQAD